ncbi:hypothetical protein ABK040_006939 [Willaertia magna]
MEQDQQLEHSRHHLYDSGNHSGSVIKPLPIYSYPYFLYIGNDEDNKLDEIRMSNPMEFFKILFYHQIHSNFKFNELNYYLNYLIVYFENLQNDLQNNLKNNLNEIDKSLPNFNLKYFNEIILFIFNYFFLQNKMTINLFLKENLNILNLNQNHTSFDFLLFGQKYRTTFQINKPKEYYLKSFQLNKLNYFIYLYLSNICRSNDLLIYKNRYVNIGLFKYKKEINFIEFYLNNLQSILQSTLQQFSLQNNLQQSSLQNEIFEKAIEILKIYLNKLKENETIFKLIEKVNNKEITKETNEIANNLIKIAPNSVVAWFYYSFYYGFEYSINLTTVDPDKAKHAIESFEMTTLSKCSYPLIEIYKPLIYENIGMIYENLDLPDKAVIYYDKCCELSFEYTTFWANNTRALMNLYRGEYLLAYNDLITILDECILKTNVKDIDIYYVCNLITDILTCIDEIEWSLNRNNDDLEDDNDKKKLKYSRQEVINILERFGASNFSLKACFFKLGEREINAEIFLKEVQRCIYVDTDELVQFGNSLYDILVEDLGSEEIVNKNYYYLFHPIQKRTG